MLRSIAPMLASLVLCACASAGPSRRASAVRSKADRLRKAKASEADVVAAVPIKALHRLSFRHTQVSSCSQTFDVTKTEGSLTLDLRDLRRVELSAERTIRSSGRSGGKSYHSQPRGDRCRWTGTAKRLQSGVEATLQLAAKAPFSCSWDGTTSSRKPLRRIVVVCKQHRRALRTAGRAKTPPRLLELLACTLTKPQPRALEAALLDGTLYVSPQEKLLLDVTSDETMVIDGNTRGLLLQ